MRRIRGKSRGMKEWIAAAASAIALSGCASRGRDLDLLHHVRAGEYGYARSYLNKEVGSGSKSRQLLPLINLGLVDLADGLARESEPIFNQVFEILRLRDVNAGTRLTAAVVNEGVTYFKGEPFEQAMAYCYVAVQKASIGDFDNCRAAAVAALELLDEYDSFRGITAASPTGHPYAVHRNTFALAMMLAGLGNVGMGRGEEASDYFARAVEVAPSLAPAAEALVQRGANTVFVVDFGAGPAKIQDGQAVSFASVTPSDERQVGVAVNGTPQGQFALAVDLNGMAQRYSWDELRGSREFKQALGEGMMIGGAVVAANADDEEAAIVGLSLFVAGLLTQATTRADLRQMDILPQRVYIVPAYVSEPDSTIELSLPGTVGMTLAGIDPPRDRLQVRYVRIGQWDRSGGWADSGEVLYANDNYAQHIDGQELPYILGGSCVRTPTHEVLAEYQAAGFLRGMTLADLLELYRQEGIRIGTDGTGGRLGRHILEGGNWLFTPQEGTAGYARLYGVPRRPWEPRSDAVRRLRDEIQGQIGDMQQP